MDITPVFEAAFRLAEIVLILIIIPLLAERFGTDKLKRVMLLVEKLVEAAEQLYPKEQGVEKKIYVMEKAQAILASRGLKVSYDELNNYVEATVLRLHQKLVGE